jgi:hypothetical protein
VPGALCAGQDADHLPVAGNIYLWNNKADGDEYTQDVICLPTYKCIDKGDDAPF